MRTSDRLRIFGRSRTTIAIAAVAGIAVSCWLLASAKPSWWVPPESQRADEPLRQRARDLEQNLAAAISRVRPSGEPWAIRIRDGDVNAWLATRLPEWKEHDPTLAWPMDGVEAQVRFERGSAVVSISSGDRVWSGWIEPEIDGEFIRWVPGRGALGRIPVPYGATLAMRFVEGDAAKLLSIPRTFKLGDGRQVEVRQVEFVDGAMEVEFVTR